MNDLICVWFQMKDWQRAYPYLVVNDMQNTEDKYKAGVDI